MSNVKTIKQPIRIPKGTVGHKVGMSRDDDLKVRMLNLRRELLGMLGIVNKELDNNSCVYCGRKS